MHDERNDALDEGKQEDLAPKEPDAPQEKPNRIREIYLLVHDLVFILAAVTLFFVFVVRVVNVVGYSMYPTLVDGDYVALLSNTLYHSDDIQDGDIVVALAVNFDDEAIVKRVIATEGETVDIDFQKGIVYVNGKALEEDYINELTTRSFGQMGVTFPLTVQEGHVFLMGDNRNRSSDSRLATIGQVDTRYILGKVLFVLFPGFDSNYTNTRTFSRFGTVS